MRTYLAEHAGIKPVREFFLLWALGADLPGAVTVVPSVGELWPSDVPDDKNRGNGRRGNVLRFSLAGMHLKN